MKLITAIVKPFKLQDIKEALTEVETGNYVQARVLFENFITDYPGSSLKGDALSALHELGEASAETGETAQTAQTAQTGETAQTVGTAGTAQTAETAETAEKPAAE